MAKTVVSGSIGLSTSQLLAELHARQQLAQETLAEIEKGLKVSPGTTKSKTKAAPVAAATSLEIPKPKRVRGPRGSKKTDAKPAKAKAAATEVKASKPEKEGGRPRKVNSTSAYVMGALNGNPKSIAAVLTDIMANGWQSDSDKPIQIVRSTLAALKKEGHVKAVERGLYARA